MPKGRQLLALVQGSCLWDYFNLSLRLVPGWSLEGYQLQMIISSFKARKKGTVEWHQLCLPHYGEKPSCDY